MEITIEMLTNAYSRIGRVSWYHLFLICIVLDIVTGYGKALVTKKMDSTIGLKGLIKHFTVVLIVILVCPYLYLVGYQKIAIAFICFFIATYGVSILENLGEMNIPVPAFVAKYLNRLKDKYNDLEGE